VLHGRAEDLDTDDHPILRLPAVLLRDDDVALEQPVVRLHRPGPAPGRAGAEQPQDPLAGLLEQPDHLPLGPALAVIPHDAHRDPVAVHEVSDAARRHEDVGPAGVPRDEPESARVPLDRPRHDRLAARLQARPVPPVPATALADLVPDKGAGRPARVRGSGPFTQRVAVPADLHHHLLVQQVAQDALELVAVVPIEPQEAQQVPGGCRAVARPPHEIQQGLPGLLFDATHRRNLARNRRAGVC
jgi:hypothetical protein